MIYVVQMCDNYSSAILLYLTNCVTLGRVGD